jgi:hypothetical protein
VARITRLSGYGWRLDQDRRPAGNTVGRLSRNLRCAEGSRRDSADLAHAADHHAGTTQDHDRHA